MAWRRGQAYSQDLRDRILSAEGSARSVAAQFVVSVSYVVKCVSGESGWDRSRRVRSIRTPAANWLGWRRRFRAMRPSMPMQRSRSSGPGCTLNTRPMPVPG
jgi:hypothetical protein